jgi:hypothetical protein
VKSKKTTLKLIPVKPKKDLLSSLRHLKNQFGACGLKLSTEDAAMSIEQISYWAEFSSNTL